MSRSKGFIRFLSPRARKRRFGCNNGIDYHSSSIISCNLVQIVITEFKFISRLYIVSAMGGAALIIHKAQRLTELRMFRSRSVLT